ncbi:MAG TPA: PAS domain-containing protein [Steroidobacteraceae bacterium]|nr:PAS domain-containing protein [Steroidobacteraceae bacterium]
MATSPDFLRIASSAARALADTALDSLRDAVLVVDARHKHLPVVLANAAARQCLSESDPATLIETPVALLLGAASATNIYPLLTSLTDSSTSASRVIAWRLVRGVQPAATDLKLLASAGQRLVMLTFTPPTPQPDLVTAVDQLPYDVLILDTELKVTYANAGAIRSAGPVPGGAVGYSALMLTPTLLLKPEVFAGALQGHAYHDESLVFEEPGRPARRFEIDVQPLKGASGIVGLAILSLEVTERRAGNRAQGNGERRLLALTEHAQDIITIAAADGRVKYVSAGVQNTLGYTAEERESNFVFELAHPEDREELRAQYRRLVAGDIKSFSREFRTLHKDGSYRWLESRCVSALANPLISGVVINSRDITERKHAESRLAQREEVFRLAADAVAGVIYEWDLVKGVVHRSRGVQEVLGMIPEDLDQSVDAWMERIHPRDSAAAKKVIGAALINGRGWTTTYRIRDAKGRYKSLLDRAVVQRNAAGDPVRAIGCSVDISEIKRLTDILEETQRIAKIGGWEYSYATEELTWTDEVYRIFGTNAREFNLTWDAMLAQFVPESQALFRQACREAEAGAGHIDLELQIDTLKDQRIWVRVIGHLEMLAGRPFRAYGSVQNIHAHKIAQLALEKSTGWLKLSMSMANLHAWRWDRAQNSFEFANLENPQIHLPSVFPDLQTLLARVHPKDQSAVKRAIDAAFAGQVDVRQEFELLGNDGRYRSYATTARPVFDGAAPRGLVGVIQDVTARRDSERRLRRSEELLRATTSNTADTLFLLDTAMRVRFVNNAVNGLLPEQMIGREIDTLLPEAARVGVLRKLGHILETGETTTFEFESREAEQARYFENRAMLVRDDGIATGISISMRDITERKRLEQEILDVSGRERQSIGRDLHDGLGQELTGVALMLRGLSSRIQQRCPDVVDNVNEIVGHLNQSIETARSLARGLLPVRTETGGLSAALRALAARSRDVHGLEVTFSAEVCPDFNFTETNASHLYRITQEALTNAARHGRASLVDIVLIAREEGFSLRITDNGVGFVPKPSPSGMGLKIMKYRADMIGAKFKIATNKPHGAVITVTG